MRLVYTLIFYLALPLIVLRLLWRGIKAPAYRKRWCERFGSGLKLINDKPVIWVHAVSVGEVEASRPLIECLQQDYPLYQLLITTMTPTGSERVIKLFGHSVAHVYLPYDIPFALKRFIKAARPKIAVIMETELWPNLIFQCQRQSIPLFLANARLSARSAKGYQRLGGFIIKLLNQFTAIGAQADADKHRFIDLGAAPSIVHAIGNLKYEITMPNQLEAEAKALRSDWGNRPVWLAASTHEGEDEILLKAYKDLRQTHPDLLLIIVPRHPERFDQVAALSQQSGFITHRRSVDHTAQADTQVFVVDTMGELALFYACCDVTLVGGSLVPTGGHNILEPAALSKAILTGPHYFNFQTITEQFLLNDAVLSVDENTLAASVSELLTDSLRRDKMGQAAYELVQQNQGATQRMLALISPYV